MREIKGVVFIAFMLGLAVMAGPGPSDIQVVGASAPSTISSTVVPPVTERSTIFSDRGRTYIVGLSSGRVTFFDSPSPSPIIPPFNPPNPSLVGLSKSAYDSVMALNLNAQDRVLGANALIVSIEATVSEAGGLGIEDPQQIVNTLAATAEANQVNTLLRGFKLGDLLAGANIKTRDQILTALGDIKKGLEKIK